MRCCLDRPPSSTCVCTSGGKSFYYLLSLFRLWNSDCLHSKTKTLIPIMCVWSICGIFWKDCGCCNPTLSNYIKSHLSIANITIKKKKNQSLVLKYPHINIKNWRQTWCWRTQFAFFWELFWVDAGANLLNILQIKYWCLPRIHSAGDGAQQPENIKIMQMHLRKPHCFLSIWNIEILWKQQLILCMKLYCKCKGLTPGVTVLIPVAHRIQFSIYLSCSAHNWTLSGRGGKKPCFSNHLYSCVIVAGYRHFWISDMAADPVSALKINHRMPQNKHGGRNQQTERDT